MGRTARARPELLAEKLRLLRDWLDLSQNELISRMDLKGVLHQNEVSAYECGRREPTLIFLLKIARVTGGRSGAGKVLEMLLDDGLRLSLPKGKRGKAAKGKGGPGGKGRSSSRTRAKRRG